MCSAVGYPVAERPRVHPEWKSIFYDRIQSGGDRMQFDQIAATSLSAGRGAVGWPLAAHARQGEELPYRVFGKMTAQEAARVLGLELIVLNATNDEEIDQGDAA
jgi:hypothetical protein